VTPEEFLADVAAVYIGGSADGAFGSGRLIAPALVLTAGHVVDYPTREQPMRTGWKVCLLKERRQSGEWVGSPHEAQLLWRGSGDIDLALLRLSGDAELTPTLKPVFASYNLFDSMEKVEAAGFPQAWLTETGTIRDYRVPGSLRIATQHGPYTWSVAPADKPDDPHGWKGMSGAAVCKVGPDNELYLFGAVQEVPANFSGGLLQVSRLSAAFADEGFCNALRVASGSEPRIDPWVVPERGHEILPTPETRVIIRDRAPVVPSEQAPVGYVDRPELTGPLLAHLLDDEPLPKGRAMISAVHGLGGIGKTTIARWLVWRPEIERRFRDGRIWVTLGNEPEDALKIISDCVSQLDPVALKTKATVEAARAELATLLQNRSVLFVVDDVWPGKSASVAKALLVPSSYSRFLLTSRFSRLTDDPDIRAKDFPLDEMSVDQAKELMTHALGRKLALAEEPFAVHLCETVGGHPFALELAAARIREGRSWNTLLNDLGAEIAHLEALEEANDDLIEPPDDRAREKQKSVRASLLLSVRSLRRNGQELFARLGTISEDATINPKMAATLWATDEETALRHLRSLRGAGILKAEGDLYRIHDLMHDLAREILTAPVIAERERGISGLGLTLQDASRQLLERYRAKTSNGLWHTFPEDGYIHDHFVQHLERANWESEFESLLWEESADGHCGWHWARERLGQTPGFLADVRRIWSHADRVFAAAAIDGHIDGHEAQAIGLQLHCALIIASMNSLSAGIPTAALVGAARCRLIALPVALTFARQHPNARSRVVALLALAHEMLQKQQSDVLREALSAARGIDDASSRAEALASVAPRLPAEEQPIVLGEALSVARGIDVARARALALVSVAPQLPSEEQTSVLREALAIAHGIDHPLSRVQALAAVAPRLPEEQTRVLREALNIARSIDDGWRRAEALAAVARWLPAEEALVVAHGIDAPPYRAQALRAIAPQLPTKEALVVARGIDHAVVRALALAEIGSRLPAEEQMSVLREALSAARSTDDESERDGTLSMVAQWLPAEEALVVVRSINDVSLRVGALAAVGLRLPAEEQPTVVGEALSTARSIDDAWFRARALAKVASRLSAEEQPSMLGEALSIARGIDDVLLRALALAEIASRLPAAEQTSVLREALCAARSTDDAISRDGTLSVVAQWLPAEEALVVARGIDVAPLRAPALAEIASRLPAEEQTSVLREALCAARSIEDAISRDHALAAVAPRLPAAEALVVARGIDVAPLRARVLAAVAPRLAAEEALVVARDIDFAWARVQALAAVVPRLAAEEQPNVLHEALSVARSIDDAISRAEALASVAPGLPAEEQPNVLHEALSAARGIIDLGREGIRDGALAAIAPQLQAEEALVVARGIDGVSYRAQALAAIAAPLSFGRTRDFILNQWIDTIRVLAMRRRSDCVSDFAAIVLVIDALGGEAAIRILGRSITSVGWWWPGSPKSRLGLLQKS
jgi:hypothetical protein